MLKKTEQWLPHAAILICNMYVVLYLIDRVNPAMNFIDNRLTKGLLLLMCAVMLLNARRMLTRPAPAARAGLQARQRRTDYAGRGYALGRAPEGRAAYRSDGYRRDAGYYGGQDRYERRGETPRSDDRARYDRPATYRRDGYARRQSPYDRGDARR